ncbi:carbohydrate ABC transporter permease [Clostridium beijerinckii]|jgi:carbohydrate ABC transporter membrane protein 2, CUT1 family (TC 3.A.1.1.-)|uniref:Carbohydrate ABC transporter permease n=2 Tax=Clostridium beijerinckii TaxID=1520 RepID=A0AAE2V419_CLOBE|nr:carbohydrate ABC transporter permease [Clostridium beijerinckii]ABR33620.1 binding-protein-dependent transport systems inner membrane component [Clostridium beijerinckii NCIMB 8052]AIU01974.1 binding-protein-dependent transport systems inner membrane component [Clostridium beijerinckii ATCC 35702]MBF7812036.1 carbohydrate ABC transporter permease [Clostridium beijerinckii]NRT25109.1 raffinose/stachyose/melibiose transport system permease protein [Clostridium beijerinckii]NRT67297.1 raffinos
MKSIKTRNVIGEVIGIILALIILSPFILVVLNSAKTSADIVISPLSIPNKWGQMLTNFKNVINNDSFNYWKSFFSSLFITVVSLTLLSLFSSMTAWVLCRNKKKWSGFIFMLLVAAMVIPFQVVMLPLLSTFRNISNFLGIQMLQSYQGVIFAYLGFGGSMSVFILHGFIKGIPRELEEAAWIDGCSPEGTFFRIIFPLLKPVQMTILILNGIWIWNDYLLPSLMLGLNGKIKTLPVAVSAFVGSYVKQWDLILSAAFLAMIPIIILFLFAQKQIIKGIVDGAIK